MSDISVTAANVLVVSDGNIERNFAYGATITAGQSVYLDESQSPPRWELADCDDTAVKSGSGTQIGVTLTGGADGQPGTVLKGGTYAAGGTVTVGEIYVLSGNAGGICPEGDLASGDYVTVVGVGVSVANIQLILKASGVQVPA